jgi:2-C-methyl-D-erythritol 4-phosphate cytidylyltransferase
VWTIVLGGGSGSRFGNSVTNGVTNGVTVPKQYLDLGGRSLIEHSIAAAATVSQGVVAVVPDPAAAQARALDVDLVVAGGASRAESTRAGLAAVPHEATVIVVADAAHPLASPALYAAVVRAVLDGAAGAFPGLPLVDVVAELRPDGARGRSLDRAAHVSVQVPQAFRAEMLRAAHAEAVRPDCRFDALTLVEDSAMVAALHADGAPARVVAVPGEARNVHVTTPEDLDLARALLLATPAPTFP